jgi:hypothetical protein
MKRYFKGVQSHITIEKIEAEIAFLPGPPEMAFEIAEKFSSYEKVTEQREFVTYKGEIEGKNVYVKGKKQEEIEQPYLFLTTRLHGFSRENNIGIKFQYSISYITPYFTN